MSQQFPEGYSEKFLIPNDLIQDNPWQTRPLVPEKVQEKVASIREHGLLQPPLARVVGPDGKPFDLYTVLADGMPDGLREYHCTVQIAFAHHRLAAFRELAKEDLQKWGRFPVFLQVISDEQMALFGWEENERRSDLNPIERAEAIERYMKDFGWTQVQTAEKLKKDRATLANDLRLLKLPKEIRELVASGERSPRQAMALLPLFDLPEEVKERADAAPYTINSPSKVVRRFLQNNESSDQVREAVEATITLGTIDLTGQEFLDHPFEGEQYRAATCAACKLRIKRGDHQRCPSPKCFEAKKAAWQAQKSAAVAKATGLPVAHDLEYNEYHSFWGEEKELMQAVVAEKSCEHLALKEGASGISIDGAPGYGVVCAHGKGKRCTCLAAALKKKRKDDPAVAAKKAAEKSIKAIHEEAAEWVIVALLAGNPAAWWEVWERVKLYDDKSKLTKGSPVVQVQRAIGARIAEVCGFNRISWQDRENPDKVRAFFTAWLREMGQAPSWADLIQSPAEVAQEKFERIAGWTRDLVREFPTEAAVRGNLANLKDLLKVEELSAEQRWAIHHSENLLARMLILIQQWTAADEFRRVSALVTVPSGDGNFQTALESATPLVIRYALLFIPEENNKTKIDALMRRLRKLEGEQVEADILTPGKLPGETLIAYFQRTDPSFPKSEQDGAFPTL